MSDDAPFPKEWVGKKVRVEYKGRSRPPVEVTHQEAIGLLRETTRLGIVLDEDTLDREEPKPVFIAYDAIVVLEPDPDTRDHDRMRAWMEDEF